MYSEIMAVRALIVPAILFFFLGALAYFAVFGQLSYSDTRLLPVSQPRRTEKLHNSTVSGAATKVAESEPKNSSKLESAYSKFPKLVHYMWKSIDIAPPEETIRWQRGCRAVNPDHKFNMYYDADLLTFVENNYPEYLGLFKSLKGVYMADMARVIYIYHYGGIYMDLDFYCYRPFTCIVDSLLPQDTLKQEEDILIVSLEPQVHANIFREKDRVVIQDFYMATPRHPFFKWFLDDRLKKFLKDPSRPSKGPFSYSIESEIDEYRVLVKPIEMERKRANSAVQSTNSNSGNDSDAVGRGRKSGSRNGHGTGHTSNSNSNSNSSDSSNSRSSPRGKGGRSRRDPLKRTNSRLLLAKSTELQSKSVNVTSASTVSTSGQSEGKTDSKTKTLSSLKSKTTDNKVANTKAESGKSVAVTEKTASSKSNSSAASATSGAQMNVTTTLSSSSISGTAGTGAVAVAGLGSESVKYGFIYELPEDILHSLVDSTNWRLDHVCYGRSGGKPGIWSYITSAFSSPQPIPAHAKASCEKVRRREYFSPTERTVAVHMWTHVFLGWSFLRGLYKSSVYDEVEGRLTPDMHCPKLA